MVYRHRPTFLQSLKHNWNCKKCCPKPSIPPEIRFWKQVNKNGPNGCWIWNGARDPFGHGKLRFKQEGQWGMIKAHRLSWILHNGPIPDNMFVCHHCYNPPCCNPSHLFVGTPQDNTRDAIRKDRMGFIGKDNPHSKLTEDQVRFIKAYPKTYGNQTKLARMFNVSQFAIRSIIVGDGWKHIIV